MSVFAMRTADDRSPILISSAQCERFKCEAFEVPSANLKAQKYTD